MKTPMQELIEQLKEAEFASLDDVMYRGDIRNTRRLAESMLEKEKEVMCEFAIKYAMADRKDPCETSTQLVFDETFNNKVKII
jgi:hypothetical protein